MDSNRLDELLDLYLDGALSPQDKSELESILLSEPSARDQFWDHAKFHSSLRLYGEQASCKHESVEKLLAILLPSKDQPSAPIVSPTSGFPPPIITSIIFMLLLLVAGTLWFTNRPTVQPDQHADTEFSSDGSTTAAAESFVGIVIGQSSDANWAGTSRGLGHAIGHKQLKLEKGEATLQLDNGVEIQLRSPSELTMLSVDHGILHSGQLSARVPPEAIGFHIEAPGVNVVDLGTEFSLAIGESGAPQVHVFEGKVRAEIANEPSSVKELVTGETASFESGKVAVRFDEDDLGEFPKLAGDKDLPKTFGKLVFLRQAPQTLINGTYEHDSIMVFREQQDLALPEQLSVLRGVTNQRLSDEGDSVPEYVEIDAGTRVQSYLVHFDRVDARGGPGFTAEGTVRFKEPILGFIVKRKSLDRTDEIFRHPKTVYEQANTRPLEMRFVGRAHRSHDEVYLSDDGHELTMTLRGGNAVDQFRVLVAVEGQ